VGDRGGDSACCAITGHRGPDKDLEGETAKGKTRMSCLSTATALSTAADLGTHRPKITALLLKIVFLLVTVSVAAATTNFICA
jgi:hypothetical protein